MAEPVDSPPNRLPDPWPDPLSNLLDLPRPIIALARDFPDGHLIQAHSHHRAQLLYASSGVMTVTTAQGIWVVPPLRAVWVPAETEHQVLCSGSLSMRSLYLDPSAVPGLPEQCLVLSVSPLLRELILEAVRLPSLYELGGLEERIMLLILDLIQTLRVTPLDLPTTDEPRLERITRSLIHNPADNRTLEDWGRLVGASGRTLARLFKSRTGLTFRQWRQQIRILEALKRLGQGEPVTAIALDLGYDSPSAFIHMFRKALGQTPGQYFQGRDQDLHP